MLQSRRVPVSLQVPAQAAGISGWAPAVAGRQEDLDRLAGEITESLGAEEFGAAYRRGQALSPEEAVEVALEGVGTSAP